MIYFITRQEVLAATLPAVSHSGCLTMPVVVLRIQIQFDWLPVSVLRRPWRHIKNARSDEIYLNSYYGTLRNLNMRRQLGELRRALAGQLLSPPLLPHPLHR